MIVESVIRLILFIYALIIALVLMTGCATTKAVTEYKYVNIPVKCVVEMPQRPLDTGDILVNNALILKYTETLENLLNKCI